MIKKNKNAIVIVVAFFAMFGYLHFANIGIPPESTYLEFVSKMEAGEISEVTIALNKATFEYKDKEGNTFTTDNPKVDNFKETLLNNNVKVEEVSPSNINLFALISSVIQISIFIYIAKSLMKTVGGKELTSMEGSSKKIPDVSFDEVAGIDEIKDDMLLLSSFLKNPSAYEEMGATLPKGVVLYGPPGTGKTLVAKAIANEAGVPFLSVSGSDFVEMYVGLGAKRVRELFKKAKKEAPCIVFIDEIDAVGTKRGSGTGSNSEKDQTINALLNELDGFGGNEGVLVITATNRISDLDSALIRPGRFDKHIAVNLPDLKGRKDIIAVHSKNKKFAEDVNLDDLAKITIGFSGAYLESLLNESAIIATSKEHTVITNEDIDDAYYKIATKGHKKKNSERNDSETELTAWHEAGHALATKLLTDKDVPKVTIIPSTSGFGGATFITPTSKTLSSKKDLENEIKVFYAGRAAEELLYRDTSLISTGASQDIQQATSIIKNMVSKFGMDKGNNLLDILEINPSFDLVPIAREIAEEQYNTVKKLLQENEDALKAIAEALIKKETIGEKDLDSIISQFTTETTLKEIS